MNDTVVNNLAVNLLIESTFHQQKKNQLFKIKVKYFKITH